jgi:hypothetical protein
LQATNIPIVTPRGCDCLSRLLEGPENGIEPLRLTNSALSHQAEYRIPTLAQGRLHQTTREQKDFGFQQLAARFGDEVARYFHDEFVHIMGTRPHTLFMPKPAPGLGARSRTPLAKTEPTPWAYDTARRYMSLFQKMVDGYWDYQDFLVVPPGWQLALAYDGKIAACEVAS